ncbi:MAG: Adenine-specific methylase [Myxococcaceae bacterium]|nr:Adenine-specific methylase [Myxococcaceae bacterium]
MIKYIGSKRLLVPAIVDIVGRVNSLCPVRRVLDLFSGTSRVGHALKAAGYEVTANDHTTYAYKLAQCYVAADRSALLEPVRQLLAELNQLVGSPGYFTDTFCERSRYLQPHNGARVDAIRERIAELSLEPLLEAVLLVSLMEAADRVDSTCGLQMAYLKKWSARSHNALELRVPAMLDGPGCALQQEAHDAARAQSYDLVYLDPPYNQHRYLGNYHVWESLVRWDKPEVYGTAMKRIDCKAYKSDFNSKPRIAGALADVANAVDARYLLVSFSNEGYLTRHDVQDMLRARGEVAWIDVDYKRYVGAQIGIYNPSGEKVGQVSHLRNRECLFLVGPKATRLLRNPNWGEQLSLKQLGAT